MMAMFVPLSVTVPVPPERVRDRDDDDDAGCPFVLRGGGVGAQGAAQLGEELRLLAADARKLRRSGGPHSARVFQHEVCASVTRFSASALSAHQVRSS